MVKLYDTFSKKLDELCGHRPKIFAHFFIGREEHVGIVVIFPGILWKMKLI